ncbi:MAG: hypothetical protein JKY45_00900, partial [Emcibacter sp.]|nr:hypothetical protein [Emcibacter sp.]
MMRLILILLSLAFLLSAGARADSTEYLITGTKPGYIHILDMEKQQVVRSHKIPNAGRTVFSFAPSPDGKIIYVLTNRMKSIVGLDSDTGEQVFRADFIEGDIRRQAFYAFDVTWILEQAPETAQRVLFSATM